MLKLERHNEKVEAVTVNPFLTIMYKSLSFKAWLKIYSIYNFFEWNLFYRIKQRLERLGERNGSRKRKLRGRSLFSVIILYKLYLIEMMMIMHM